VRVLHGKGGKATTRGFHPSCDDALARWIDTRKARGIHGGTLFCTLQGRAVSDQYVRNALHRLGVRAHAVFFRGIHLPHRSCPIQARYISDSSDLHCDTPDQVFELWAQ
jgi:site-specific recombinase XerC